MFKVELTKAESEIFWEGPHFGRPWCAEESTTEVEILAGGPIIVPLMADALQNIRRI